MSKNRCFSNANDSNNSSSDYTKQTKQQTIFSDVVNQVQTQTKFIKNNGVNYNENFGLHNQCLSFAKSYELLLDVTKGKYYAAPVKDPQWVSNEAWSASLYSVDYSANQVNTVVDTSYNAGNANHIIFPMTQSAELADISWNGLYPGVRVDPSYNIFYNQCKDQNYWRKKLVDMSFNNTNYSNETKQKSEQLYGMSYPTNIKFNCYPNTDIPCDSNIHGSVTFNYTGTIQTFTKPEGVCIITIEAIGGGGGAFQEGANTVAGGGGKVTSSFNVPVIECTFNIYVGGGGEKYNNTTTAKGGISLYNYGTNGQTGSGGNVTSAAPGSVGGAGGALSCVIINQQYSYSINRQMLIIAGGGGGASDGSVPAANGGYGGGNVTADGQDAPTYDPNIGSKGGKADGTGGAGGGGVLAGGSGGNNGNNVGNGGNNYQNGAGGGGYGGGSGGGGNNTPGGGGSSFSNGFNTTYAYITTHTNSQPGEGGTAGNNTTATSGRAGKITITY